MAGPYRAARAFALALATLALSGALEARAAGWTTREALDPFDGIVLTIASVPSEYLDGRLQVECRDDGASRGLRVRLVPTGGTGAGATIDPDAVTELLVRVDESPTRSFGAEALSVASDEGGGTVVGDRSGGQARVRAFIDDLAAGDRAWAKLRVPGRDGLFSYDLEGAGAAIDAPLKACGETVRNARDGSAGPRAADASSARTGAPDAGRRDARAAGTTASPEDARVTLSPAEMSAASTALPDGLDMRGLVDRLDGTLDRADGALEGVARGDDPRDALPGVRAAADALGKFRGVFRRLPDAAAAPLSRIAAARAGRIRDLADAALAVPGAGATLAPAVGSLLDSLGRIEGRDP